MPSLPTKLYDVASVREIDRLTIEAGTAGYALMKHAGADATDFACDRWPDAKTWQVVCGPGNNAGDGYVVARLALQRGIAVDVISLVDPELLGGDAAKAYADYVDAGGKVALWPQKLRPDCDLLIDAILGRGSLRDVEGSFADAIAALNKHSAKVFALDIPSGLDGDSGAIRGIAVNAEATMAFVALSPGLFIDAARRCTGDLHFSPLQIDRAIRDKVTAASRRVTVAECDEHLGPRAGNAHKGDFGHVLVVGGGPGMPGAARLCGEAALRAGAGRVTVATHFAHSDTIAATRPELMVQGIETGSDIAGLLESADVVAFGPGLGRSPWAADIFAQMVEFEGLAVWDADALNYLSNQPSTRDSRVITPHPGEAARLLGLSSHAVQDDRTAALHALQQRYGGTVVLKGAGTLTSCKGATPRLTTAGNPGMATAGMGDVLTGIIAALLAQGLAPDDAAAIGATIHARAGDIAAAGGERGLLASDVVSALRGIVNPRMRAL